MPEIAVKKEIAQTRLAAAKLTDGPFEVATLMIWHSDKWISPTLKSFMDMVGELYKNTD
jgi:DNA-binding transcriptional LysR family regulator